MLSLLPIALLVTMLVSTIHTFGSDALLGASQVSLLTVSAFCVFIGMTYLHVPWASFEKAITKNVASVASALIILLLIGALSGAWMVSGVVPTLIYYGLQIMHPDVFLMSTCIICALVSVMTGSSWTTIATIGIALMGIGQALGFSDGLIAGAIISGAYFGDKISAGFLVTPEGYNDTSTFVTALNERFNITPWLLLVPVITGVMIARRVPPIITLFMATLVAVAFGLIFQRETMLDIEPSLFKAAMRCVYDTTSLTTDNEMLTELVTTRGMAGMMGTIWLIICAMCFGGTMTASGMVGGISRLFIHMVRGRTSLVGSTVSTGLMINLAIADQYLCILLSGNMFKDIYDRQGYERRLLSRTIEDSVTVTSVLVPWNTCGMTQSTVLGVSTFVYLPYCFFNLLSPIVSVVVAAIGYKIFKVESTDAIDHNPTNLEEK